MLKEQVTTEKERYIGQKKQTCRRLNWSSPKKVVRSISFEPLVLEDLERKAMKQRVSVSLLINELCRSQLLKGQCTPKGLTPREVKSVLNVFSRLAQSMSKRVLSGV